MFCRKCGVHLKGNERFCPRCGAEIITGANDIWEQNAYGNTNAPIAEEADVSVGTSENEKNPELKNRKKKKKAKIVIPVLIVVMLAMCFVGIYGLHILDENKKVEETDIAQSSSTVGSDEKSKNTLSNPKWGSSGNVTYDCVWFGSYPQSDATGEKKDPIKWRVLSINENDALLMADCNLDYRPYNITYESVTWETSTIRSWLNGYTASDNADGLDYSSNNFIDKAFTSAEQNAINQVMVVVDNDNPDYGTEDKIFLLSIEEVTNRDYGFSSERSEGDEARWRKNTEFAVKQGACTWGEMDESYGNGSWWLRSPGDYTINAAEVYYDGNVITNGLNVDYYGDAICPALHLNLSSDVWNYAGTVCTDGTVDETPIAKARADK